MTTMTRDELDSLIRCAMDTGISQGLIPAETAVLMRARLDMLLSVAVTGENEHDWDGCLMCAVREMTEGRPKDWLSQIKPEPGDKVTGVVLRQGEQPSHYEARVPYVDLWLGGIERVRVAGHGMSLREALLAAEIQVGDTVTVLFEKITQIQRGPRMGQEYRVYQVEAKRGHH